MVKHQAIHTTLLAAFLVLLSSSLVVAATPNSLILNEANMVRGEGGDLNGYLQAGKVDQELLNRVGNGRLQGNGQNWLEFLVVNGDGAANTIDLRGWKIEWSYQDPDPGDENKHGNGTITFTNDPLWAAVPRGSMITISEWQQVWYSAPASGGPGEDPTFEGGLQRDGGINGFGTQKGTAFVSGQPLLDLSTSKVWNPSAQAGPDWNIHVFAGDRNPDTSFKYFTFSGTVTNDAEVLSVGVDADAGLFSVNNDNWQYTIRDAQGAGNIIQGPLGEAISGFGNISSSEVMKLEAFAQGTNPTLASYQGITGSNYNDGSSSTLGGLNRWTDSSVAKVQDLNPLRNWFSSIVPGDANLDGTVSFGDFLALQNNFSSTGGWQQGDFNGDGSVTFGDFLVLQNHFGQSSAAPAFSSVPEPSTLAIFFIGTVLFGVGTRLRRRRSVL